MKSLSKSNIPHAILHADVRRLLKKYQCALQLHQVRALFMGAIVSPVEQINPLQQVKMLWDGALPEMKSVRAADELIQVLITGLWNQLATDCEAGNPFTLIENGSVVTEKELKAWAQIKSEEIGSFLSGFFQGSDSLDVLTELHESLDVLVDLNGMFSGVARIPSKRTTDEDEEIRSLMRQLTQLVTIAEREINNIIDITTRDSRQSGGVSPTFH